MLNNNAAFIDSNNLYQAIKVLGWKLDDAKFRIFLSDKYDIQKAYLCIGYLPQNQAMYTKLQQKGYILVFKPVLTLKDGTTKGNCDADLVLRAMVEYPNYDKAVIVAGDGDYYSLIDYLKSQDKLEQVLIPNEERYSALLKKVNNEHLKYVSFISRMRNKLEYSSERP
ncbi:MAG: NYN domain-containing protein [Patescibacteria group bacterium]